MWYNGYSQKEIATPCGENKKSLENSEKGIDNMIKVWYNVNS